MQDFDRDLPSEIAVRCAVHRADRAAPDRSFDSILVPDDAPDADDRKLPALRARSARRRHRHASRALARRRQRAGVFGDRHRELLLPPLVQIMRRERFGRRQADFHLGAEVTFRLGSTRSTECVLVAEDDADPVVVRGMRALTSDGRTRSGGEVRRARVGLLPLLDAALRRRRHRRAMRDGQRVLASGGRRSMRRSRAERRVGIEEDAPAERLFVLVVSSWLRPGGVEDRTWCRGKRGLRVEDCALTGGDGIERHGKLIDDRLELSDVRRIEWCDPKRPSERGHLSCGLRSEHDRRRARDAKLEHVPAETGRRSHERYRDDVLRERDPHEPRELLAVSEIGDERFTERGHATSMLAKLQKRRSRIALDLRPEIIARTPENSATSLRRDTFGDAA